MQGHEGQLIERQKRASQSQRQALLVGAEHLALFGYDAFFWNSADPFYRSMALPSQSGANGAEAIAQLASSFLSHGRQPRIEFSMKLGLGFVKI